MLQMLLDLCLEGRFRQRADDLLDLRPIFEEEDGWNASDAESSRSLSILVYIQFGDRDLPLVFGCQFIKDGRDHPAWTAPFSPKINQDQPLPFDDLLIIIVVRDLNDLVRRHISLPCGLMK